MWRGGTPEAHVKGGGIAAVLCAEADAPSPHIVGCKMVHNLGNAFRSKPLGRELPTTQSSFGYSCQGHPQNTGRTKCSVRMFPLPSCQFLVHFHTETSQQTPGKHRCKANAMKPLHRACTWPVRQDVLCAQGVLCTCMLQLRARA